jgi:hypothetical protein
VCFCSYHYRGLADAEESAFAASIALQAYFESRSITPSQLVQCLEYWRDNVSERIDPVRRKHPVCCEPFCIPTPNCGLCYRLTHPRRKIPYGAETATTETVEVYEAYERKRLKQIETYETFTGPVQTSTLCRLCGCRRAFGRKGCCFCTEGCADCDRKAGDPAPPLESMTGMMTLMRPLFSSRCLVHRHEILSSEDGDGILTSARTFWKKRSKLPS